MANPCIFKWKFDCDGRNYDLTKAGADRIATIIKFSKEYQDDMHVKLEETLAGNPELTIDCHRSCVSTYTSKLQLSRQKKRQSASVNDLGTPSQPSKKHCRSQVPTFKFKENCLFCGEQCELERDKKHPGRWKRAALCRTANAGPSQKTFKQSILDTCDKRKDEIASQVRVRVEGALSDLHAADARYHTSCMSSFMSPRSVSAASNSSQIKEDVDQAFQDLLEEMEKDKSCLWNSAELYAQYQLYGGKELSRRSLLARIQEHFLDDIAILSSPGLSSIIIFRSNAKALLHLSSDDEEDQQSLLIKKLAKIICKEVKDIELDNAHYDIRITKEDMSYSVSQTMMDLLASLSDNLNNTLPALLIGNIITSIISNKATNLQLALGNLIRDSKALINHIYQFRVTCSYDEILRFKKSAALAATKDIKLSGIHQGSMGLIQAVADNFDANISSQNGKLTTHSLAMLITQPKIASPDDQHPRESIPRIPKADMSKPNDFEIQVHRYQGPKRVPMPESCSRKNVLPLKVLCSSVISERRAKDLDVSFLNEVINNDSCPEYNGYNTRQTREQRVSMEPETRAVYLPLIDMPPSDPDTIMTALYEAKRLTNERGQKNAIFTSDQQLYKVAVDVQWAYPKEFSDVIVRLGGMHMLMSFVGAVGALMQGSGLAEVLESTFAGVTKMLSGKKFPQNVRAMRLVVEELLRGVMANESIDSMEALLGRLDDAAAASKTSKLWVDCFIKPVLLMMLYVRAEREGDWPLHLVAVKQMLPYFFAASHVNYARYGLYYLRSMESLGNEEIVMFMKGQHVMHHVPGLWNGIWSDMFIETTFMRYGHGPGGIIGITLKPETLKTWALGLHICCRLEQDITDLTENNQVKCQETHKEETKARIKSDGADRENIRKKLALCIDPLNPASHPSNIVNIVSGQVADNTVNVHDALSIGTTSMKEFEKSWPEGFQNAISKKVKTISGSQKHVKVGKEKVYDCTIIYSRVIGIQASTRNIDIKKVLSHELAPVPTSMFQDSGAMRICKAKAELKKRLAKESSTRRTASNVTTCVLDGSAVLWVIHWPAKGMIKDFVQNFKSFLARKLLDSNVYLVFDRYREWSTKGSTREARECEASRVYQLSENTPLPSQKVVLTVSENKKQLMAIICQSIISDLPFHAYTATNKLVITGDDVPTEIHRGVVISRHDIATSHEEADNIIAQQAIRCAKEHPGTTMVVADDTDVFALLLYHYLNEDLSSPMIMSSPIQQRSQVDIKATVQEHQDIIPCLLGAHALSGCDTVPTYFGIGKGTVVKNLKAAPDSLTLLGCPGTPLLDVVDQATRFIGGCYSSKVGAETTMSDMRYKIWASKFGNTTTSTPKIQSLPPSTEAFTENVKRAHLQTLIWKAAVLLDPPSIDPVEFGYVRHEPSKSLVPVTVPAGVPLAPDEILSLIKCNCQGDKRCGTQRCSCSRQKLPCTLFCGCNAGNECFNELTAV